MVAATLAAALTAGPAAAQPGNTPPVADPPSGPGLGIQNPPAPPPPALTGVDANPLNDNEREVLKEVEAEWLRYTGLAEEHHQRMREALLRAFKDKTDELEARYAQRIAAAEANRRDRHRDTIELLEKFIKDHPDHARYTPDAMYRLADLYLDQAEDAIDTADLTTEVVADYSKSLEYWQRILDQFPTYRQIPSVLYLLGYYGKTKDERHSLVLFLSLACANKHKWTDPPPPVLTKDEAMASSSSPGTVKW